MSWLQVCSLLVNAVLVPLVTGIGYLLKSTLDALKQSQAQHDERLLGHDNELREIRQEMTSQQRDFCSKEDFIREMARTRQSLEKIASRLDQDEGSKQAMISIGAAIASAITERRPE